MIFNCIIGLQNILNRRYTKRIAGILQTWYSCFTTNTIQGEISYYEQKYNTRCISKAINYQVGIKKFFNRGCNTL